MTWQILIASVYARTPQLAALLQGLAAQIAPYHGQVRVLVDRDDCQQPVGAKRTRLLEAADAMFVCFVDDDDQVADDYVSRIMPHLANFEDFVDYVGFRVAYTIDGAPQKDAVHSLRYPVWSEDEHAYYRGISHLNPVRRDAALAGLPFRDGFGEDAEWAEKVQATGLVRREAFIDRPLYRYAYSRSGSLFASGPQRVGADPGIPVFEHVQVLSENAKRAR